MSIKAYTTDAVGLRVRVIGPGYYHGKCDGQIGVIRALWSLGNIAVELENMKNPRSSRGYFYFKLSELELFDTEENNTATAVAEEKGENEMQKMNDYLNVAVIQFVDGPRKTYEYANYEPDLAVGDLCVVMSAHHGLGLAYVEQIKERTDEDLCREIVAKVDCSCYETRAERRKQAAELKAKMKERAKQLQDIVLYQTLAREDAEMAQLLRDYQALTN